MKKFLTLSNLLKLVALVFGLVAFFLMFTDQLSLGSSVKGYVAFDDAMFGEGGSVITFIGYLLILLSTFAVCALMFLKLDKKMVKLVNLILAFVLILGAVFVFIEASVVNSNSIFTYQLTAGPVIAGILAILAGLLVAASVFAPNKAVSK